MLYDQKYTIAGAKKKLKVAPVPEKQLSLGLSEKRYITLLQDIKSELLTLNGMLQKSL
jgi:hypothetical protein